MTMHQQKSSFAGDVLKMATAPLVTQLLGIILMPIVTRLYAPDVYGAFTLFGSVLMPICIFATMGYNGAIVLPEKEEVAANMFCVCLGFTVLVAALTLPFNWLASESLCRWLKSPELLLYLWIIPISVLLYGLQLALVPWNVRSKQFGRVAASKISLAVVNKVAIIGTGIAGLATTGALIMGGIISSLIMNGILGGRIWQASGKLFKRSVNWREMFQGIKRYRKFPMYNLGTELVNRLSGLMTVFLFASYFSTSAVGYYGLGIAVLSMPATFVGSSIVEIFYQRAAAAREEGLRASIVEILFKQMTWLSMLAFLVLAVIGDNLFAVVFGAKWAQAGVYCQILSFSIFISFIMGPSLALVNVLEKQEFGLIINIANAVISFIAIIAGGLLTNIYLALSLLSLLSGLLFFTFGLLMIRFVGVPLSRIFAILLKCFLTCLPVIIVVAAVKWYFSASTLTILLVSFIGGTIYYAKLFKEDKLLQSTFLAVLGKFRLPGKS